MLTSTKNRKKNKHKNIWIIGCGYIGHKVATIYQKQSVQTNVTARSKGSVAEAVSSGHRAIILDLDENLSEDLLGKETEIASNITLSINNAQVFYFVPPPRQGLKDTRLRNFLKSVKGLPQRIILISTTGIYGDCKGEWVDETQAINPIADRAWRRIDAEKQLVQWMEIYNQCGNNHHEIIILRVPGIYAEDKLPATRLKKELPIVNDTESPWTNRIHADDLAAICYLAMESSYPNEVFNVSDGHPSTMTTYFNQVADYLGLPRPRQISLQQAEKELSSGMMSYMKESRRISNKKIMKMLNIKLRYPSLSDCLKKKHQTP